MSIPSRRLIAAATALGLGLSGATQAIGAPAQSPAKQRPAGRQSGADPADLALLDRPGHRFKKSLEAAHREVRKTEASTAGDRGAPGDGYPTPESVGVSSATLEAIASCESGDDPSAVSADGTYRGKYQFDYGTWASVGGHGDPAAAPEAEQDIRAQILLERAGTSPWPVCG